MFFLASRAARSQACGISLAEPFPTPTLPRPSPTTIVARNRTNLPPFSTFVTRVNSTICSSNPDLDFSPSRRPSYSPKSEASESKSIAA